MVTNLLTFSAFIIVAKAAVNFDWAAAKTELKSKRALWLNTGITSYVYHFEGDYHLEDDPCFVGEKYIEINGGNVTDVRFDPDRIRYNSAICISNLSTSDFKDINFYYDKAIEHAQRGIDANCPNMTAFRIGIDPTPNSICGGSVSFQYEEMLYYPTSISLRYGPIMPQIQTTMPQIQTTSSIDYEHDEGTSLGSSDISKSWTFSCLTPMSDWKSITIDLSLYANECDGECASCTGYTTVVDPYCCGDGGDAVFGNLCIAACAGCTETGYKMFPDGLNGTEIACEECECFDVYEPVCCDGKHYSNGCNAACDGYSHSECIARSGPWRKYEDVYECSCTDWQSLEFIKRYKFVAALDEDIMFCNICFCDDEHTQTCVDKIDGLPQRKKLMDRFMWKCKNLECDFDFVGLKDGLSNLSESDVCDCTLFECKYERVVRTVYNESGYDGLWNLTEDSNSDANGIGVFIGSEFVAVVSWLIILNIKFI